MDCDSSDLSLHTLVSDDDTQDTDELFKYADPLSCPAMMIAVLENNLPALKLLVEMGRSVNNNDNRGYTCLHTAIMEDRHEIFDYLLTLEDIRLDVEDFTHCTPLCLSIFQQNDHYFTELLKCGVDVNQGEIVAIGSPLHVAISQNSTKMASILIENGADINNMNFEQATPLNLACYHRHEDCIHLLMYYNADPTIMNQHFHSPLTSLLLGKQMVFNNDTLQRTDPGIINILIEYVGEVNPHDLTELVSSYPECGNHMLSNLTDIRFELFYTCSIDTMDLILWLCNSVSWHLIPYHDQTVDRDHCFFAKVSSIKDLIFVILSEGVDVKSVHLYRVFQCLGYCDVFKTMLHMNFENNSPNDIGQSPCVLCRLIIDPTINFRMVCKAFTQKHAAGPGWDKILKYTALLPHSSPVVPKLTELARNAARDYIVTHFNVEFSYQYYKIVNNMLNIPKTCKEILSFELPLY